MTATCNCTDKATEKQIEKIKARLKGANGNRRTRTLEFEDIASEIERAGKNKFLGFDGGRVANAYKYAASTTNVVAYCNRGRWWVLVMVTSAKGGTGRGDFIHGDKWTGPTNAKDLAAARFLPLPTFYRSTEQIKAVEVTNDTKLRIDHETWGESTTFLDLDDARRAARDCGWGEVNIEVRGGNVIQDDEIVIGRELTDQEDAQ